MQVNLSDLLENAILGMLINQLNDFGYRVVISKEDAEGYTWVYGIKDNGELKPKNGYDFWVQCREGNGKDFIIDYTTNLESVVKPVNAFCEMFN